MQSAQIPDSEIWTTERLPRLTQNRQCTHLSLVQAQHYRVALESRAIRNLNHKSETVRIRLRGLDAFMRWVVVSLFSNITAHSAFLEDCPDICEDRHNDNFF